MASQMIKATAFNDKTLLRTGRCTLKALKYVNENTLTTFCQVFDASAVGSVTLGTTTPDWIFVAAQNGGDDDFVGEGGLIFGNGIVVAGTTTALGSTLSAGASNHVFAGIE